MVPTMPDSQVDTAAAADQAAAVEIINTEKLTKVYPGGVHAVRGL